MIWLRDVLLVLWSFHQLWERMNDQNMLINISETIKEVIQGHSNSNIELLKLFDSVFH